MDRVPAPKPLGALFVALVFSLSGCIVADEADDPAAGPGAGSSGARPVVFWQKDACDPSPAESVSQNAPWLGPWQASPEEIAERFAGALGHELPPLDEAASSEGWWVWEADDAHFRYSEEGPAWDTGHQVQAGLQYSTPERWPPDDADEAEEAMERFLTRFGVYVEEDSVVLTDSGFYQTFGGERLRAAVGDHVRGDGSGRMGWWSGFDVYALYDLGDATVRVSEAQAEATAKAFDRCALDREGKTEEAGYVFEGSDHWGIDVRNASIVHQVSVWYEEPPPYGHCGFGHIVNIDAVTGAVHGWEWPPCD